MPQRTPYPSLDAMTDPVELGRLIGRPVATVEASPVEAPYTSTEARFERLTLDGEASPSLFLKVVEPAQDWVALVTADGGRRAVAVWSEGLFDLMPTEVDPAVIACAEWVDGYALLMPNLEAELVPPGSPMTTNTYDAVLHAMAAMHASFWEHPRLDDRRLGLCAPEAFLSHTSPKRAAEHRRQLDSWVFGLIEEGWDALPTFIDRGLVRELRQLNDDPDPIMAALQAGPRTFVHSDIRPANLAISDQEDMLAVALIDWGRPLAGAPSIDLGYLLGWTAVERPYSVDEAITRYEGQLRGRLGDRLDETRWRSAREVGLLGGLLNTLCFHALGSRGEEPAATVQAAALASWEPRLREMVALL